VIAIVKEENNFAADLRLQASGADDLRVQESFWKKTAWLLTEADDGRGHGG